MPPPPVTFDLFNLESGVRVMCDCLSVPILVFLGVSLLDVGPMYATDRQTDRRQTDVIQHHRLMPLPSGRGITTIDSRSIVSLFNRSPSQLSLSNSLSTTVDSIPYMFTVGMRKPELHRCSCFRSGQWAESCRPID